MVEVPDTLQSLFTGSVEERDGRYVVTIPRREVAHGTVEAGDVCRVAILPQVAADESDPAAADPPVSEGDVRSVTVETTGDQGDGIAKVERGYVVIVPGAEPGDEVTVELATVHENFAIAEAVE
jgi:predicted RNA-binding protein with TRAM domain